ncbi:MAG: methylglyoxal synthase [Firmicutes bacterium]|nr:methylglyoxal synthase [Bacillota bacterium]
MRIALIAHDKKKPEMIELCREFRDKLAGHQLFATGTTGGLIREHVGLEVHCFRSGPLGGDQQIGARIADGEMDMVIFLRDPLTAHPHEPDVSALLRLCDVRNIPVATNVATARLLLSCL